MNSKESNSKQTSCDQSVLAAARELERFSDVDAMAVSKEAVQAAVSAVARLYAKAIEDAGSEFSPVDANLPTTEALTLCCALLRSQNLTPFDMAMWFGRQDSQRGAA